MFSTTVVIVTQIVMTHAVTSLHHYHCQ